MADESVITPSETNPVASVAAAADSHKRKLEDFEVNNAPEAATESEHHSDHESLKGGSQEEGNTGVSESEAKRPRLESNDDSIDEADVSGDSNVPQNGHTEEKEEHGTNEVSEQPEFDNSVQEPVEEPVKTDADETAPDDNEKIDVASTEALVQPNEVTEEPSNIPREGDVPVDCTERESHSDTQILSRKMEVPNDKVGVLIGKAGDTIRTLQDNSGAKIQIVKDADADPQSTSRPLELLGTLASINRAERLIKDVIAEADAGGSPSLVARGFSTVQAASGGVQLEIRVPIEKVGLIIGKGGETIRNLQTRSGAHIQLIQPNDGDQSRVKMVRVTGNKKQIEIAREMIKDVMNQNIKPSPLSGGYNQQQSYCSRGPIAPQWGPRASNHAQFSGYDYPHRGQYPSQSSQYPPSYGNYPPPQAPRSNFGPSWEQRPPATMHGPSPQGNYSYGQQPGPDYGHPAPYPQAPPSQPYGHGYNEAKYGHMGSQASPYAQHSSYGGPQDQYGKPPMYGQPRPNQHGEVPYQGPGSATQSYGQNMPPQQSYPYRSTAPAQQSYPPYGGTTVGYGHTPSTASASAYPQSGQQPVAGYSQPGAQPPPVYPQTAPAEGYGSYSSGQPGYTEQSSANNTTYGYQGPTDPAAYGAAQAQPAYSIQTQPTYDQSGGYGKSMSAQLAYPQYDSSQVYGAPR